MHSAPSITHNAPNGRAGLRPATALQRSALPSGMGILPMIHGQDARATVTRPAALARFDYDAWGRTVTKRRVSGAATHRAVYGYRFGQRLKSVQTDIPGEQSADYNYDGLGKRRNKVIDGDATWFRWDAGWNMIAEYDGGANQLDWDPGDLALTYVPGLAQVPGTNPATGAYGYFAADHLGSTRGVYDQSKAMAAALEYAPYGEPRTWRGDAPAPTYTGHYHDAESGLYFAPYRYYLPDAGRWLTRDPLGMVDGPNVYGYVGGGPVRLSDLLGLRMTEAECYGLFNDCAAIARDRLLSTLNALGVAVGVGAAVACLASKNPFVCLAALGIGLIDVILLLPQLKAYNRRMRDCKYYLDRCLDNCEEVN